MTRKQTFTLLLVLGLILALLAGLNLVEQRQEIRKEAAAAKATLALFPTSENFDLDEVKRYELKATFTDGESTETLDYFKTEINFNNANLLVPLDQYIDTASSGFDKILRVDGPTVANETGKITIELSAAVPGQGPSTDQALTIAVVNFKANGPTHEEQSLTIENSKIVNNLSVEIPVETQLASYTVGQSVTVSPISGVPVDGSVIPVGDKDRLIININGEGTIPPIDPNTPYARFAIKLFSAQKTPEIAVRLKVIDQLTQLTPILAIGDTGNSCYQEGEGEFFYLDISMVASDGGIYTPKPNSEFVLRGDKYIISEDGYVPLVGLSSGRVVSFFVKGPKHRSVKMVSGILLEAGMSQAQDFDWTGNPVEPGDLPDPNNNMRQDCIVNSIDLSLIESRIGSTDKDNLDISDVNFDGVVNGNDIAQVVGTLSTKSDDDI